MKQNAFLWFCSGDEGKKTKKKSALSNRANRCVHCNFNLFAVARLCMCPCYLICIEQFVMYKRATARAVSHVSRFFFCVCIVADAGNAAQINSNLSRAKVKQWLAKYPRSTWWINNSRLADFCGINHQGKVHNTTILGKFLPHGQNFWDRSKGLNEILRFMHFDCACFFLSLFCFIMWV